MDAEHQGGVSDVMNGKVRGYVWFGWRANWRLWMGGTVQTKAARVELEAQGQVSKSKASSLGRMENPSNDAAI